MKLMLLLAEKKNDFGTALPLLILMILMIVGMVFMFFSNKKKQGEADKMLSELKVGDKVVTNAGIYGEIVSIRQTNFGKVALLKTGEDNNVSYISVNFQVILGIDEKKDVVLDADGNVIDPDAEKEETATTEKPVEQENIEKAAIEKAEEVKSEENSSKPKTTAKKSPAKKSAKKETKK